MAPPPPKTWEDEQKSEEEETDSDDEIVKGPAPVVVPRRKFDDEEGEDSDVLDSWDAAEDSEVEREKAKKAAEAKAKAEAEAKANHKSKSERIAQRLAEKKAAAEAANEDDESIGETVEEKQRRLRAQQKEADLSHAEDLFGGAGGGNMAARRGGAAAGATVVMADPSKPDSIIDLATLPLFNPRTKTQLDQLATALGPLLAQHHKMPSFVSFAQELSKAMVKHLASDQVKKVASSLTALSNEKMKTEKAADKSKPKKSTKAKSSLNISSTPHAAIGEDQGFYNDGDGAFDDDDFM